MVKNHPMVRRLQPKRHWHAASEVYTGADSLVTALQDGWQLRGVFVEKQHKPSHRCVAIYHFDLMRDDTQVTMRVIANPWVDRFVDSICADMVSDSDFETQPMNLSFTLSR